MKRYGAPDAKLKDIQRNSAQSSRSTLQVAHLIHYHRQEGYGARYANKKVIDPRTATCCINTQRLQKTCTVCSARR